MTDYRYPLFERARRRAELSVQQLWLRYLALGGSYDVFDLDAFLNGLNTLSGGEQDVLAHALNERLDELYRDAQVPLLTPLPALTSDSEDPLAVVWDLLASPAQRPAEDAGRHPTDLDQNGDR